MTLWSSIRRAASLPRAAARSAQEVRSAAPDANISVGTRQVGPIDFGVRRSFRGHDGLSATRTKQPVLDDGRYSHCAAASWARADPFALRGFHGPPLIPSLDRNFTQIKRGRSACCSYAMDGVTTLFMARPRRLRLFTFRIEPAQLEAARLRAQVLGIPYQQVLRLWISIGARAEQKAAAQRDRYPVTRQLIVQAQQTVARSRALKERRPKPGR